MKTFYAFVLKRLWQSGNLEERRAIVTVLCKYVAGAAPMAGEKEYQTIVVALCVHISQDEGIYKSCSTELPKIFNALNNKKGIQALLKILQRDVGLEAFGAAEILSLQEEEEGLTETLIQLAEEGLPLAAHALCGEPHIGNMEITKRLVILANDKKKGDWTRAAAAEVLCHHANSRSEVSRVATRAIVNLSTDPMASIRRQIAYALSWISISRSLKKTAKRILIKLSSDFQWSVREYAVKALVKGGFTGQDVIAALKERCDDESQLTREEAKKRYWELLRKNFR